MKVPKEIAAIWRQNEIPVVLRRSGNGERPRARLPGQPSFNIEHFRWIRNERRSIPAWNAQKHFWEFPKAWFNDFVDRGLKKYGRLYVIQPFREHEVCARACMEATGHECQCSCMGENHGSGIDGSWFEVTEAFAMRSGEPRLACRLMVLKPPHSAH